MNTKKFFYSIEASLICSAMIFNLSSVAEAQSQVTDDIKERTATVTLSDIDFVQAEVLSNSDSGFLFCDQLDSNNTLAYEAMGTYLENPADTSFTIQLKENIVLERSSININNWSDEEYSEYANAILSAVMPGVIAFTLDYPELFWLNFSEIGCGTPSNSLSYSIGSTKKWKITISKITVTPNYDTNFTDFDTVLDVKNSVDQIVQDYEITGETDYEKCKSIYESIIANTDYEITARYAHGIAGVLYDKKAVCEGYSKTFKILCDRENIPCLSVLGNFDESNLTAHMWNYVYLDGAWYGCDPTYDESTGDFRYFMRGSDYFNKSHTPESPYSVITLSFPELSPTDYTPKSEVTTTLPITTTTNEDTILTSETTESYTTTTTVEYTTTALTSTETVTTTTTDNTASSSTATETSESDIITTSVSTFETTTYTTSETSATSATTSEIVYGDINNDGEISLIDLLLLRKFINGIDIAPIEFINAFDCNNDGSVNILDAVFLFEITLNQYS